MDAPLPVSAAASPAKYEKIRRLPVPAGKHLRKCLPPSGDPVSGSARRVRKSDPEINFQDLVHFRQDFVRVPGRIKFQFPSQFSCRRSDIQHLPSQESSPARFFLVVHLHAHEGHLLFGQCAVDAEELFRPLQAHPLHHGALRKFLAVYAVFDPQPQNAGGFIQRGPLPQPEKEIRDTLKIQPFHRQADDHIQIVIRLPVREKCEKRRVKSVALRRIPDDVHGASRAAGIMLLNHICAAILRCSAAGLIRIRPSGSGLSGSLPRSYPSPVCARTRQMSC